MDFIFQCLKWIINAQISKLSIELLMYWLFHDLSCELDEEHPWLLTFF